MTTTYTGTCSCGEIEFTATGEPMNAVFCYCTECQQDTGTDKWFGLWFATEDLTFTKGKPQTFTRQGSTGNPVHKKFCGSCGTAVCSEITAANFYTVAASALKDNNRFTPQMAIFTASAPDWAVFPENVPQFPSFPDTRGE